MRNWLHVCAVALFFWLAAVGAAQAATVYFEFTGSSLIPDIGPQPPHPGPYIQQISGTVTGHIDGLVDNSTSAATGVFIDSAPAALAMDYSLNLVDTFFVYKNTSELSGGAITHYNIESSTSSRSIEDAEFTISDATQLTYNGPTIPFAGLAVLKGNQFLGVVSEAGVSFSAVPFPVSPVPLPSGLLMFGSAMFGLFGLGIKSRRNYRAISGSVLAS